MGKKIIRWLFAILGGTIGYGIMSLISSLFKLEFANRIYEISIYSIVIILFLLLFYFLSNSFVKTVKNLIDKLDSHIKKLDSSDLVLGTIGLIIGLGISYIVVNIISKINIPILAGILSVLAYITIVSICIAIAVRRKDEYRALFKNSRLKDSEKEKEQEIEEEENQTARKKFLDTSAIIDGRIYDVLKTGFLEGEFFVPSFVLEELQLIADSTDSLKRERGRRGLDILNNLTHDFSDQVKIFDSKKSKQNGVDLMLLELCQRENGICMTTDYNLNKVATVRDIKVLNINDLSNALRPVVLPGESFELLIVKEGKEEGQGVGFLNDGTMVVVEDGKNYIDMTKKVTVNSVLQTSAGRMIFVRVNQ